MTAAYTCKRCGYEAKDKWNLKRHLEKVRPCKANSPDDAPSASDLLRDLSHDYRFKDQNTVRAKLHVCENCEKAYSHESGLIKHKANCKKHQNEMLKSEIEHDIMARVQAMLQDNANGINNTGIGTSIKNISNTMVANVTNTVTNNTINIHVNKFGIEDRSYIPEHFLTKCLKQRGNGVVELARVTHFHKNHPCNKNVRARNITSLVKYGSLEIFNGEQWTPADSDSVLKQIFNRNYTALDDHLGNNEDQLKRELGAVLYTSIEQWFDQVRNCDPDKTRDVKEALRKLKWLILENSSWPENKIAG